MKKLLLLFACSLAISANAQNTVNITTQQYGLMKQNHQLDLTKNYVFTNLVHSTSAPVHYKMKPGGQKSQSSICSCLIPLDSTFSVCEFLGSGGSGGPGVAPDYRNDDWSTPIKALPFNFNFFGTNYDSIYINNNGNVTFSSPYSIFTSVAFPDPTYVMIAPFWGDVDTRDSLSGLVYYKITSSAIIIKWEHVGYYPVMSDKLNTFQLILTDGTDPLLPAGDNVGFCYGDMQWTTGSASGGVNGFGGTPATVGVNNGNGVDYFQVGRYDSAGVAFDGPYGNNDKVDWLDNQGMYFNVAAVGNVPPIIINNNICDTIDVYTGDTTHTMLIDSVRFMVGITTPEINQTVNATVSSPDASHLSYTISQSSPTYIEYQCSFSVLALAPGIHYVTVTATDNGTPASVSTKTIYVHSHFDPSLTTTSISENNNSASISVYPNPANSSIIIRHGFSAGSNPMLSVTNVVGQNVMHTTLTSQEQSIDISKLTKGVYFATIVSKEGNSKTIKVVKK
ncbi:MAG: nidogen-like domain-containing protein [Bacteroidota bacterium]